MRYVRHAPPHSTLIPPCYRHCRTRGRPFTRHRGHAAQLAPAGRTALRYGLFLTCFATSNQSTETVHNSLPPGRPSAELKRASAPGQWQVPRVVMQGSGSPSRSNHSPTPKYAHIKFSRVPLALYLTCTAALQRRGVEEHSSLFSLSLSPKRTAQHDRQPGAPLLQLPSR